MRMSRLVMVAVTFPGLISASLVVSQEIGNAARLAGCGESTTTTSHYTVWSNPNGYTVKNQQTTSSTSGVCDNDPWEYRYREKICGSGANATFCVGVACADPQATGYIRQRRLEGSDGVWRSNGIACVAPDRPTVTPDRVLTALKRIGLPKAELQTEPGFESGKTLVNFDTNFYTDVEPVTDTFTLLGARVTVEASPVSYTWHFDSGRSDETRTTTTPGAPYPELDVTYAYDDAHRTVHPSVDVTYEARFSVNGGTWQTIPETVTIEGDPISRYVAEAEARLSDMN